MNIATGRVGKSSARACRSCAVAKAKCVPTFRSDEIDCERCTRLKLRCERQMPVVRKRRQPKPKRINQLEDRLESIVNLLITSHQSQLFKNAESSAQSHLISQEFPQSHLVVQSQPHTNLASDRPLQDNSTLEAPNISGPQGVSDILLSTYLAPSPKTLLPNGRAPQHLEHSDHDLFNVFRNHMCLYFPFVIIRSESSDTIRAERPFLFRTILLGASNQKLITQSPTARDILQSYSTRYLLDGHADLDLLQAILVFIVWGHFRFRNNPQVTVLVQLAMTLVVELGLNKAPSIKKSRREELDRATPPLCQGQPMSQYHSPEEMRAFLGCFYLSSVISTSFKKVQAMAYTPYINECCSCLEQLNEHPTDFFLIKLIQMQILARKIAYSLPCENLEPLWGPLNPVGMIISEIERELQIILPDSHTDVPFLLHYHAFRMSLYEAGFCEPQVALSFQNFPQLELLYSSLNSVKSYFDAFFTIGTEIYYRLPSVIWIQLANALQISGRLLLIHVPGWDLEHARAQLDLKAIFSRLAERYEAASKLALSSKVILKHEELFHSYAALMRSGIVACEARLTTEVAEVQLEDERLDLLSKSPGFPEASFWKESFIDWGEFGDFAGAWS